MELLHNWDYAAQALNLMPFFFALFYLKIDLVEGINEINK